MRKRTGGRRVLGRLLAQDLSEIALLFGAQTTEPEPDYTSVTDPNTGEEIG